jgi:gas vesicle protein
MYKPIKKHSDAALAAFGLQTRRPLAHYIVPVVSILSVGLLTGAGLGVLFAPRRGRELRARIGRGVSKTLREASAGLRPLRSKFAAAARELSDDGGSDDPSTDAGSGAHDGEVHGKTKGHTAHLETQSPQNGIIVEAHANR